MRVAEDERPPRQDVVHVPIAVHVDEVGPLASLDEERRAADRAEGAHRRADAARKELQRLGEELVGARPDRAGHRGTAWSACATERAAPSPESMQSGIPTPR